VVKPNKTTSLADGKDATVINITVVDKQGREVPDANNPIQFALTGNAKIIGVGNGDPSSHEADKCANEQWQRTLFNGKCQVIIQAGTQPDKLYFEARSAGLEKGAVDMVAERPKS
jgi:beta-galactosidase